MPSEIKEKETSLNSSGADLTSRLALRPQEAAESLGVSQRTLRKWMRDEGLPHLRVAGAVLLPVGGIEAWLAERSASEQRSERLAKQILQEL